MKKKACSLFFHYFSFTHAADYFAPVHKDQRSHAKSAHHADDRDSPGAKQHRRCCCGLFSGFCIDMQFGPVLGFYALLGMYTGIAAGSLSRRIYRENVLVVVFFTFVYSIAYESVVFIINNIMSGDIGFTFAFTR